MVGVQPFRPDAYSISKSVPGLKSVQDLCDDASADGQAAFADGELGALLQGNRDEVERGQGLAKPGSITPHRRFKAEVYVLRKDEGGRHNAFFTGYRPQFYIRTLDVTSEITCRKVWRWSCLETEST